ncbi:MAG: CopG family transcriptional regulator [Candidatus Limnocylindrales bacterium]
MQRTQISITAQQAARLKRAASDRGISMAHVVREAIDAYVVDNASSQTELVKRALAAAGRFRSGASDVAQRHDDYLAEDRDGW